MTRGHCTLSSSGASPRDLRYAVKVNIDYHIEYRKHLYSVPHHLIGERVDVHASAQVMGLYFHGTRVASHPRRDGYGMSTTAGHMPAAHQHHQQQAFRVCLGLRKYSAQRLNQACGLANHHELYRLQQIKDILQSNQDTMFQPAKPTTYQLPQDHENIRGPHSVVPIAFTKGKPHATHQFTTPTPTQTHWYGQCAINAA